MKPFVGKITKVVMIVMLFYPLTFAGVCHSAETESTGRPATAAGCGYYNVDVRGNRLSLEARHADLRQVLREISRLTGIVIRSMPEVEARVSTSFSGLRLEEALNRITANLGVVFSKDKDGRSWRIERIFVPQSEKGHQRVTDEYSPKWSDKRGVSHNSSSTRGADAQGRKGLSQLQGFSNKGRPAKYVPGEILVRFKEGVPLSEARRVMAEKAMRLKRYNRSADYGVLALPEDISVKEAASRLANHEMISFAEPNYLLSLQEVPNDPRYFEQWALQNMDAEEAWDLEVGCPQVVIAVIDTGVAWDHADLADNIWTNAGEDWVNGNPGNNGEDDDGNGFKDDYLGWDFVADTQDCRDADCEERDANPMDSHGHGTHVAGIVGAISNNNEGVAGVTWHCKVMAVRAAYENGAGTGILEVEDAADAIRYAVDNGAHVLNLSWGDNGDFTPVREAVSYAVENGVVVCAAAGNNNSDTPFFPAAYGDPEADPPGDALMDDLVMAVGTINRYSQKAGNSNYGPWVDVSAPGVGILSTCLGGGYCNKSGTSMAAPQVAGLMGLMFSRFFGWSPLVIRDMVLDSVVVLSQLAVENAASGTINLYDALEVDSLEMARFVEFVAGSFADSDCSPQAPCDGDTNGDGDVDGADLAAIAGLSLN